MLAAPRRFGPLAGALVAGVAAVAVTFVVIATRQGVGLTPDTGVYFGTAESLGGGRGFVIPFGADGSDTLSRFPPLFPMLLAPGSWLGLSLETIARVINVTLFGVNALLAAALVRRAHRGGVWAPVAAAAAVASSQGLFALHVMAWSEPTFIALTLGFLVALEWFASSQRRSALITTAVLAGSAWLTRYVGVALVLTGALVIIGRPRLDRTKLRDLAIFAAVSCGPMFLWLVTRPSDGPGGRELGVHPIGSRHLRQALSTAGSWVMPPGTSPAWRLAMTAGAVGVVALIGLGMVRHRRLQTLAGVSSTALASAGRVVLMAGCYVFSLALSISFVDRTTPLDNRLLAPAYLLLVLALIIAARPATLALSSTGRRALAIAVVTIALLLSANVGNTSRRLGDHGLTLANEGWRSSPIVQRIKALPEGAVLYSNTPSLVYLLADRHARSLPSKQLGDRYEARRKEAVNALSSDAYLIYLPRSVPIRKTVADYAAEAGMETTFVNPAGTIYRSSR